MVRCCSLLLCSLLLFLAPYTTALRLLLHVPAFLPDGVGVVEKVEAYAAAVLGYRPTSDAHLQLDALLVFTGFKPPDLQAAGARLSARLPQSSQVFVEWLHLEDATYDKTRSSRNWTRGPNSAFYAVMKEGARRQTSASWRSDARPSR